MTLPPHDSPPCWIQAISAAGDDVDAAAAAGAAAFEVEGFEDYAGRLRDLVKEVTRRSKWLKIFILSFIMAYN